MTTYNKYTWVCTGDCDALIEYTMKDGFGWPNGVMQLTCPCNSNCTLLSVEDATIPYTDSPLPTKEETMEETTTAVTVPDTYNPNLLVTYKVIKGYSDAEYATDKVTSIEWDLHNARQAQKHNAVLHDKIDRVKEIICEAYADSQDQDTLREIAEALDIELIKEVEWSASIEVSGTYSFNILENDYDLDLESEITDAIFAESNNGNIEIGDQEVCNVREA
jgi:neutral trehalase